MISVIFHVDLVRLEETIQKKTKTRTKYEPRLITKSQRSVIWFFPVGERTSSCLHWARLLRSRWTTMRASGERFSQWFTELILQLVLFGAKTKEYILSASSIAMIDEHDESKKTHDLWGVDTNDARLGRDAVIWDFSQCFHLPLSDVSQQDCHCNNASVFSLSMSDLNSSLSSTHCLWDIQAYSYNHSIQESSYDTSWYALATPSVLSVLRTARSN